MSKEGLTSTCKKKNRLEISCCKIQVSHPPHSWVQYLSDLKGFIKGQQVPRMPFFCYTWKSACVMTGVLSSPSPLQRLCRQGCPMSPQLFALANESLAQTVTASQLVFPVVMRAHMCCISLYADDILLYRSKVLAYSYCHWFLYLSGNKDSVLQIFWKLVNSTLKDFLRCDGIPALAMSLLKK